MPPGRAASNVPRQFAALLCVLAIGALYSVFVSRSMAMAVGRDLAAARNLPLEERRAPY